jgi:glycosyltransferase involved in cell wall biosynthesis
LQYPDRIAYKHSDRVHLRHAESRRRTRVSSASFVARGKLAGVARVKNEPTISVLVPVYNGEATLERALESIRANEIQPHEVVVVDDGSTDRTPEILAAWSRLPGMRIVRLPSNGGLLAALNVGLAAAKSDYIARLDADDEWLPSHVGTLRRAVLGRPGVKLCSTGYYFCVADEPDAGQAPRAIVDLVRDNFIAHSSACFRRDALLAIGGYQPAVFEDYATWIRLVDRPDEYLAVQDMTVKIHVLPNSLSRIDRRRSLTLRYQLQREAFARYRRFLSYPRRLASQVYLLACKARLVGR